MRYEKEETMFTDIKFGHKSNTSQYERRKRLWHLNYDAAGWKAFMSSSKSAQRLHGLVLTYKSTR